MKNIVIDLLGIAGLVLVGVGLYLELSLGWASFTMGVIVFVLALMMSLFRAGS